ncbi:MAG TPA: class I SAM-dependent methyltransferase [Pararhizobium sp.]|uniref:class I SAM-dependent methyltransferase n=1 Tax=Pararhizobium sp. TaxID=1977563 RepID=UPI002B53C7AD|nr:class I SAM-dependent methyltransferase [Pararhizobium sp.]HTO30188.1 class I SAM-dependent methyltransferase [Pararhizobium sp.]
MNSCDPVTLDFYAREAETYASRSSGSKAGRLDDFLALLPQRAKILELGCGGGHDSYRMLSRGYDVTTTDGSPEMARHAETLLQRPVAVLAFDQLCETRMYDGVWANACLLHTPRPELSGVISRIHDALKPGGIFYASFKAGTAEGRDGLDRYYNYPSPDWLLAQYAPCGWERVDLEEASGGGYDELETVWLHLTAMR